jgi:hypothetical protein
MRGEVLRDLLVVIEQRDIGPDSAQIGLYARAT